MYVISTTRGVGLFAIYALKPQGCVNREETKLNSIHVTYLYHGLSGPDNAFMAKQLIASAIKGPSMYIPAIETIAADHHLERMQNKFSGTIFIRYAQSSEKHG